MRNSIGRSKREEEEDEIEEEHQKEDFQCRAVKIFEGRHFEVKIGTKILLYLLARVCGYGETRLNAVFSGNVFTDFIVRTVTAIMLQI